MKSRQPVNSEVYGFYVRCWDIHPNTPMHPGVAGATPKTGALVSSSQKSRLGGEQRARDRQGSTPEMSPFARRPSENQINRLSPIVAMVLVPSRRQLTFGESSADA